MKELLLGIDIGTSACKVALFQPDGTVVATGGAEYPVYYPQAGWVEQNPNEWWSAVCQAIKKMLDESKTDPASIKGIGIDGQSWSAIPVDKDGKVLYNTPIWMDTRAKDICEELNERIGEEKIFSVSGNPLQPSYTLPKILWYKKNLPDVYKNTYKILQSNSFIALRLTGAFTQEYSQGYGLACYNMEKCCWDKNLCLEMGVDFNMLPDLVDCHAVVGTVTEKASKETGLAIGTPVVAGALDAACGTLGAGVISAGQTQEQGGQAGGMSICLDSYKADKRLILGNHVVPGLWLLQGGTVGGGGVVRWFEKEFCEQERILAAENGTNSMYEMDMAASKIAPCSDGLTFLPYMSGERSPIWDTKAKGVYYGVDFAKTRGHFIRSSMEGVAFSLQHNLDVASSCGAKVEVLCAMGGAANSRLWTQMKADVTGKKIVVPSSDTATTLGAAILAGVGVGIYKDFSDAVARTVVVKREHIPDMEKHELYKKGYNKYLKLYENLKDLMNDEED